MSLQNITSLNLSLQTQGAALAISAVKKVAQPSRVINVFGTANDLAPNFTTVAGAITYAQSLSPEATRPVVVRLFTKLDGSFYDLTGVESWTYYAERYIFVQSDFWRLNLTTTLPSELNILPAGQTVWYLAPNGVETLWVGNEDGVAQLVTPPSGYDAPNNRYNLATFNAVDDVGAITQEDFSGIIGIGTLSSEEASLSAGVGTQSKFGGLATGFLGKNYQTSERSHGFNGVAQKRESFVFRPIPSSGATELTTDGDVPSNANRIKFPLLQGGTTLPTIVNIDIVISQENQVFVGSRRFVLDAEGGETALQTIGEDIVVVFNPPPSVTLGAATLDDDFKYIHILVESGDSASFVAYGFITIQEIFPT